MPPTLPTPKDEAFGLQGVQNGQWRHACSEVISVFEVGEYQGGFRDRVDGLMARVERGWRRRDGPVDLQRERLLVLA